MEVKLLSGALGAEVSGIDLTDSSDENFNKINELLLEHKVIFFRDQPLTSEQQILLAKKFGPLETHAYVKGLENFPEITPILKKETDTNNFGGIWHSDTTYQDEPPKGTMLYALEVPDFGGDTEFSNQYLAYDTLSEGMKNFLNNQKAVNISGKGRVAKTRSDIMKHSSVGLKCDELEAIHPVVRTHPETKRKSL